MLDASILVFITTATLLTISPGSDTMLVFRSVLARGQIAGILTTFGICTGLFAHATLSALGLSVILVHSALAYTIVKLLGAAYLIWLGVWTIIHAWRHQADQPTLHMHPEEAPQTVLRPQKPWQSFMEGIVNNILNPKPAIFYLAFLPQFIDPTDPVLLKSLLLATIHFVISIVWLVLLVLLISKLGTWITRAGIRQKLELATGAILVGLGVRLAFEPRG